MSNIIPMIRGICVACFFFNLDVLNSIESKIVNLELSVFDWVYLS